METSFTMSNVPQRIGIRRYRTEDGSTSEPHQKIMPRRYLLCWWLFWTRQINLVWKERKTLLKEVYWRMNLNGLKNIQFQQDFINFDLSMILAEHTFILLCLCASNLFCCVCRVNWCCNWTYRWWGVSVIQMMSKNVLTDILTRYSR